MRIVQCCLFCLLVCPPVFGQTADSSSTDYRVAYDKAKKIVAAYTPEKRVTVKSFSGGLRVVGVSQGAGAASQEVPGLSFDFKGPDYLKKEDLLLDLGVADAATVKLLWRAEPSLEKPDFSSFLLKLNHHQGYGVVLQKASKRVRPADYPVGAGFWTEHPFALDRAVVGVYDLYAQTTSQPVETVPLGLVLARRCRTDEKIAKLVDSAIPEGVKIFSGYLSMARWFSYRMAVQNLDFVPRRLSVISSIDWMEDAADGSVVAKISVEYDSGDREVFDLVIGRDTSSTWYDYHNQGFIGHRKATVAWATPTEYATVTFNSATYLSFFDLTRQNARPVAVEIDYVAEKGILHLYGLVFQLFGVVFSPGPVEGGTALQLQAQP